MTDRETSRAAAVAELVDVVKGYPSDAGPVRALDSVSLHVGAGELVAAVGKSGCGKSTLLNVMTGIDRVTDGAVSVAGMNLRGATENDLARWPAGAVCGRDHLPAHPHPYRCRERHAPDGLRRSGVPGTTARADARAARPCGHGRRG